MNNSSTVDAPTVDAPIVDAPTDAPTVDAPTDAPIVDAPTVEAATGGRHIVLKYIEQLERLFNADQKTPKAIDKNILEFLKNLVSSTNMTLPVFHEIMKGAFIIVRGDKGKFFDTYYYNCCKPNDEKCDIRGCGGVVKHRPKYMHLSSHWSKKPQHRNGAGILYDIGDSGLDESKQNNTFDLLIGISILPDFEGDTWFQFENSRLVSFYNKIAHTYDFVQYQAGNIWNGKSNMGPFGTSLYIELARSGPLILDVCGMNGVESCSSSDPQQVSKMYWGDETGAYLPRESVLSIKHYANLCGIIYNAGYSIDITSRVFRYEKSNPLEIMKLDGENLVAGKHLAAIISKLPSDIKPYVNDLKIDKRYFDELVILKVTSYEIDETTNVTTEIVSQPFENLYGLHKFRPDDLIMVVYRIISDTLKSNEAYKQLLMQPATASRTSYFRNPFGTVKGGKSKKYKKKQHKKTIKKRKNVSRKRKTK